MKIPLIVKFDEKDEVKKRGAQWCPKNKNWYLWDYKKITSLNNWLNQDYDIYITENIYLLTTLRICWKCGNETKVHSIGADKYIIKEENKWKFRTGFILFNNISKYSKNISFVLERTRGNFKFGYSKSIDSKYIMNHCECCNIPQGDNYLYEEVDSVFTPHSNILASKITLLKMEISLDIGIYGDPFSMYIDGKNSNYIIYKYGEKQKLSKPLY